MFACCEVQATPVMYACHVTTGNTVILCKTTWNNRCYINVHAQVTCWMDRVCWWSDDFGLCLADRSWYSPHLMTSINAPATQQNMQANQAWLHWATGYECWGSSKESLTDLIRTYFSTWMWKHSHLVKTVPLKNACTGQAACCGW